MSTKPIWQSLLHAGKHFSTPGYEKYQHICIKLIIRKLKVAKLFRQGFKTLLFSIWKVGFTVLLHHVQWFHVSFPAEVQDSTWFGGKEWVLLLGVLF